MKQKEARLWVVCMTAQIYKKKKTSSHLKILGARHVTWNTLRTEDPQVSGATAKNVTAIATGARDLWIRGVGSLLSGDQDIFCP
jgi:hypothetical protein